jgi:hypothetical protein
MKTLLIVSVLVLAFQVLSAQVKTEAYFGVSGRIDAAKDIMELYDKGIYISGGCEGYPYHFGWNIKTDVNLEMIYDHYFEHSLCTVGSFVSVSDESGNIYVAGIAVISEGWPFVTKIDSCGNKEWCKILQFDNEFENGWDQDIIITKNNEVVLLLYLDSEEEIETINLTCLTKHGEILWNKGYASKTDHPWISEPNGYSIKEINNEYYISGYCYWPYPDDTTHFFLRPLFIGIDSLFEEKWILPFYALDSVFGLSFKTMPLNDSVFMGVGVRHVYYQGLLMFYNKDGEELGYYGIEDDQLGPDINGSDIRDVVRINDTLFLTASLFGTENTGNPGGEFIVSINGSIYGSNSRPGTYIPRITKTYDNNYVIATSIEESKSDDDIYVYKIDENLNDVPFDPTPHTYDSLCPGGIQSGTIDLTDCFVWTDVSEAPSPSEYYSFIKTIPVKVYPNPVMEGSVTFEFENTEHHRNMELKCFNVYGESVHSEKVYRYQEKIAVDVSRWIKEMYVAIIYSDGLPAGRCKFVVSR